MHDRQSIEKIGGVQLVACGRKAGLILDESGRLRDFLLLCGKELFHTFHFRVVISFSQDASNAVGSFFFMFSFSKFSLRVSWWTLSTVFRHVEGDQQDVFLFRFRFRFVSVNMTMKNFCISSVGNWFCFSSTTICHSQPSKIYLLCQFQGICGIFCSV